MRAHTPNVYNDRQAPYRLQENRKGKMMIGGIVIEIIRLEDRIWVNAKNRTYNETCAIYIECNRDSEAIRVGDSIWWQGQYAMWTPQTGEFKDRKIPRIGFSGVERPRTQDGGDGAIRAET